MDRVRIANAALLRKLLLAVLLMFGFAWLLVPLYRVLCEVSGLNRVVAADALPDVTTSQPPARPVTLQLDAMVQPGLPWQVRPVQSRLQVQTGQLVQLQYEMRNNSGQSVVGQAIPRYLPAEAAAYVKKLECFCFRQQAFRPGEVRRFPVVLLIDRQLPAGIDSITLAYSVFDVPGQGRAP
ncbi:cytochrome c oxidase assembly protein [Aquitalea sp. ASV11]|uniref:cytochrome c oxidase assembly protein n=1 Tax=Aquitalea sp. ASV11 TaxID=2795103 RepID=UPI0018ED6762|nr:cytochrome c oxidase assembly protein [Aquitalea sp. ASV11]